MYYFKKEENLQPELDFFFFSVLVQLFAASKQISVFEQKNNNIVDRSIFHSKNRSFGFHVKIHTLQKKFLKSVQYSLRTARD